MRQLNLNAAIAGVVLAIAFSIAPATYAAETEVRSGCVEVRDGYRWNTCNSVDRSGANAVPGAVQGAGPGNPAAQQTQSVSLFGFSIEVSPTRVAPENSGRDPYRDGGEGRR